MAEQSQGQVVMTDEQLAGMMQDSWNKYVLECKELLDTISHTLKGEIKEIRMQKVTEEEGSIEVPVEMWIQPENPTPPMNEKGYYMTMMHMVNALDKSQASGNLHEAQAMNSIEQLMKALTILYATHYKEFGLRSVAETKALLVSIMNLLKTHLSKSIDMALIKQLASQISISEQRLTGLPKDSGGGLPNLST